MHKRLKKYLPQILVALAIAAILPQTLYMVKLQQDLRRGAVDKQAGEVLKPTDLPLYIEAGKIQVKPGDTYQLTVFDNSAKVLPYTGFVFIKSLTCFGEGQEDCTTYSGQWRDFEGRAIYVERGKAQVKVPEGMRQQTMRARFFTSAPVKKQGWSNEIVLQIKNP